MNTKESILLTAALIILGIPCFVTGIQMIPRSNPTPTAAAVLLVACRHWTADGRFCAGEVTGQGAVVCSRDGRVLLAPWAKWTRFFGWTVDGRFAIFEQVDQYGNSRGLIFDVENWEVVIPGGECAFPGRMSASCRFGFVLVDLASGKILQGTGVFLDLQAGTQIPLFPHPEKGLVWLAALSPDKTRVAIVGAAEMKNGYPQETAVGLHIANLDGSGVTTIPQLPFAPNDLYPTMLEWSEDGQMITFQAHDGRVYRYYLEDGRLESVTAVDDSP